jgi:hypothetical protein
MEAEKSKRIPPVALDDQRREVPIIKASAQVCNHKSAFAAFRVRYSASCNIRATRFSIFRLYIILRHSCVIKSPPNLK